MIDAGLDAKQRAVMDRVIAEEEAKRRHLVITLSGAHAYGFPSPDSDLDLKSIHVESTLKLLGLAPVAPTSDRMEVIDGVEIDYTSNEIKPVLIGVLQGNGNYIERILGALQPVTSAELKELKPLTQAALSKRIYWHYQGFATSQSKVLETPEKATAKKVLYVLRTALTGAHALDTGRIETDLTALMDGYGFNDARELIELKKTAERVPLGEERLARWKARVGDAFATLATARDRTPLPEEPTNADDLEAWLIALRKRYFA